jgi:hypothetical protein
MLCLKSIVFCITDVHKYSKNVGPTTKSKIHTAGPQILEGFRSWSGDLASEIYASPALKYMPIIYPAA